MLNKWQTNSFEGRIKVAMLNCVYVAVTVLLFVIPVSGQAPYVEKYFEQYVDHFNFVSFQQKTFQQRYLIQDQWWDRGVGPIFFYTGNEGPIDDFWNNTGFMFDIAKEFGALVLFAEHRFYGKSLPFGNKSFQHPYIGLLSIEQALGDYALLLTHLKQELNATDCPVISFGGSYGGMLSAYIRFKYPNLVAGSIAASAPIFLLDPKGKRDFFWKIVTEDFAATSKSSVERIKNAFREMNHVKDQPGGLQKLSKAFNLCKPLTSEADYTHLLGWIRNSFTYLAMLDYPYATDFIDKLPANPIKVACLLILGTADDISGLAKAAELFYGAAECNNIWTDFIECADPTGCGLGYDSMAWDYQACTEIRLVDGSNNKTDMFPELPFTPEIREKYCQQKWNVTPRDDWGGAQYWGQNIGTASNIVFSNGNLDPWRGGGVTDSPNEKIKVLIIEGGAHHLDLRGQNPADPPSVLAAREAEKSCIREWINKYRNSRNLN